MRAATLEGALPVRRSRHATLRRVFGNSCDHDVWPCGRQPTVPANGPVKRLCGIAFSVQTGAWWTIRAED
jgi:hypothetical protein